MEIIQSYIASVMRAPFGKYEQRILIKLAEHGQARLKGVSMRYNIRKLSNPYDSVRVDIPVKYILDAGSKHYEYVYDAVQALQRRQVTIRDSESGNWFSAALIMLARHDAKSGVVSVVVSKVFYDALYDFTHGYCKYDLATAMALKLASSSRLYIILQGMDRPIRYRVDSLKEMFGVADKYPRTSDFIKRVLAPALAEIKSCGSGTWADMVQLKDGCKITHIQFVPHARATAAQAAAEPHAVVPLMTEEVRKLLMEHAGFTVRELGHHKDLLERLRNHPLAEDIIYAIIQRARKRRAGKGYIIKALRDECSTLPKIDGCDNMS